MHTLQRYTNALTAKGLTVQPKRFNANIIAEECAPSASPIDARPFPAIDFMAAASADGEALAKAGAAAALSGKVVRGFPVRKRGQL